MMAPEIKFRNGLPTKKSLSDFLRSKGIEYGIDYLYFRDWLKMSWIGNSLDDQMKSFIPEFEFYHLECEFTPAARPCTGSLKLSRTNIQDKIPGLGRKK